MCKYCSNSKNIAHIAAMYGFALKLFAGEINPQAQLQAQIFHQKPILGLWIYVNMVIIPITDAL
jgi:hypothetical protein